MKVNSRIAEQVQEVYDWIDLQITAKFGSDSPCRGCGKCCDFESFDHNLFITSPEMIHFRINMGKDGLQQMPDGVCPYRQAGKCGVHGVRFAGCRIFFCTEDEDFQSQLSEAAIRKFKDICLENGYPYNYMELGRALNMMYDMCS